MNMEANNILKIKTTRIPPHVKGLDPWRYEGKSDIIKIEKRAKANKKKNTTNIDPFHA